MDVLFRSTKPEIIPLNFFENTETLHANEFKQLEIGNEEGLHIQKYVVFSRSLSDLSGLNEKIADRGQVLIIFFGNSRLQR
jgi:hypothetical protein